MKLLQYKIKMWAVYHDVIVEKVCQEKFEKRICTNSIQLNGSRNRVIRTLKGNHVKSQRNRKWTDRNERVTSTHTEVAHVTSKTT